MKITDEPRKGMSKVALVIEKPQSCIECPCVSIRPLYDICQAKKQAIPFEEQGVVPEWCPLVELSELLKVGE